MKKVNAEDLEVGDIINDPSYPEGRLQVLRVLVESPDTHTLPVKIYYMNLNTKVAGWGFMGGLAQIQIEDKLSSYDKGFAAGLGGDAPNTTGFSFWEYLKGYSKGSEQRQKSQMDLFSNPKKEEK